VCPFISQQAALGKTPEGTSSIRMVVTRLALAVCNNWFCTLGRLLGVLSINEGIIIPLGEEDNQ